MQKTQIQTGMPSGGPLVYPAIARFRDVTSRMFLCEAGSQDYLDLLPPGVEAGTDELAPGTIMVSFLDYGSFFLDDTPHIDTPYKELVIFIACHHEKTGPAMFVPFIYLDAFRPIVVGREILGYPKKMASLDVTNDANEYTVTVTSELGYELVHCAWAETGAMPETIEMGVPKVLNRRCFFAADSQPGEPRLAFDELTAHEGTIEAVHSMAAIDVTPDSVRFTGGEEDPLHLFGEIKTQSGIVISMDWSIDKPSEVIERYV